MGKYFKEVFCNIAFLTICSQIARRLKICICLVTVLGVVSHFFNGVECGEEKNANYMQKRLSLVHIFVTNLCNFLLINNCKME